MFANKGNIKKTVYQELSKWVVWYIQVLLIVKQYEIVGYSHEGIDERMKEIQG